MGIMRSITITSLSLITLLLLANHSTSSTTTKSSANPHLITTLNDSNFATLFYPSTPLTLVKFYTTWCGHCKTFDPVFRELAAEFDGRVRFLEVDMDESSALATRFLITGLPTLFLIDETYTIRQYTSRRDKTQISEFLSGEYKTNPISYWTNSGGLSPFGMVMGGVGWVVWILGMMKATLGVNGMIVVAVVGLVGLVGAVLVFEPKQVEVDVGENKGDDKKIPKVSKKIEKESKKVK